MIEIKKKENIFHFGKYTFNFNNRLLTYSMENKDDRIDMLLTNKESLLLKILIDNLNDITPRQEILITIWNENSYRSARSMDVYIAKLRKYLKSDDKISIKNVHSLGFKLMVAE
jgi:two-component system OmpR family response regulator